MAVSPWISTRGLPRVEGSSCRNAAWWLVELMCTPQGLNPTRLSPEAISTVTLVRMKGHALAPDGHVVSRKDAHRGLSSIFAGGFFAAVIATAVAAEGHRGQVHISWA